MLLFLESKTHCCWYNVTVTVEKLFEGLRLKKTLRRVNQYLRHVQAIIVVVEYKNCTEVFLRLF